MYCSNLDCPSLVEAGAPAEFREGIFNCTECGHALEYGDPPQAEASFEEARRFEFEPETRAHHSDFGVPGRVAVTAFGRGAEAHAVQGLLEAEGIDAAVIHEHFAGVIGAPTTAMGGVKLTVPADQAERALELIQGYSSSDAELPLEDEYGEPNEWRSRGASGNVGTVWQTPATLLFLIGTLVILRECGVKIL